MKKQDRGPAALSAWPGKTMGLLAQLVEASADGKPRYRFRGAEYLLVGSIQHGGALATPEQFEHGECSYAHLFPDGRILRFGEQIGSVHELEATAGSASASEPPALESAAPAASEKEHWADCAMNHGGAECDMGPDCGSRDPARAHPEGK